MSARNIYRLGQQVAWKWGQGEGRGKVRERFEREVTRTLQGAEIKRNGSSEDPAYLIQQDDGAKVLKLGSELKAN